MRDDQIIEAWDRVTPGQSTQQRMLDNVLSGQSSYRVRVRLFRRRVVGAVSIFVVLAVIVAMVAPRYFAVGSPIELTQSRGVQATRVNSAPTSGVMFDLVPMTEDEMLANVDIFVGTISRVDVIKVSFPSRDEYMELITVNVDSALRGSLSGGAQTQVLAHPAVSSNATCSSCAMLALLKKGTTALFLGMPTSGASFSSGSAVFYYSDVAQYYLGDPARWVFVQTAQGVQFDTWGWPTLAAEGTPAVQDGVSQVASMDVVKTFIRTKI